MALVMRCMARSMRVSAIGLLLPTVALSQSLPGLDVQVRSGGVPVANATVCVGVSNVLNQHSQGQTDSQGRVRLPIPTSFFVVTAHLGSRGAQQSISPATPGTLPLLTVSLSLPVAGGPVCPSTLPGPSRTLATREIVATQFQPQEPQMISPEIAPAHFCLGGIGMECGQPQGTLPRAALCSAGQCGVNGGSWEHDECCAAHSLGMACRNGPFDSLTGHDGNCVTSWNKAVRLTSKGLFWRRQVDFTRANRTGRVESALYCAPPNSLVPSEDAPKCCSRTTRALSATEAAATAGSGESLRACL